MADDEPGNSRAPFARLTTRRRFLRGVAGLGAAVPLAALLAACGGDDDEGGDATSTPESSGSEPTATEAAAGTETETGAETRTFEHAFGVAEIPANPERVAVLNNIALDAAMLTGITPVVARIARQMPWRDDIDAIETQVGYEIDVELLVSLAPELILDGAYDGSLFSGIDQALLEEIAPVVAYEFTNDLEWPEYFLFFADALNHLEEAEQVLARYDERIAKLQEQLGDDPPSVALLRVSIDAVWDYSTVGFVARIFQDLGLPAWAEGGDDFSLERVGEIDADVIYLYGSENDPAELQAEMDEITSSPVWQSVAAVQAGNSHAMESYWFGFGPTEAMLVLDDLERTLVGVQTGNSASPTAGDESSTEDAGDSATRSVDTPFGAVEVPANPQRVVALAEEFMLADLLDLGVQPIASTSSLPDGFYALDQFDTSNIELLSNMELDVERLVALQPDLIISYGWLVEEVGFDLLSQLAPTVAIDNSDYRAAYMNIAATFGLEDRAEERLAEYDATAEALGEELGASDRTASVATIYPGASDVTLWLGGSADLPQALLDMGFNLEPSTEAVEPTGSLNRAYISLEQVDLITGDDLFMMQSENIEGEAETLEEMTSTDLWQHILAVVAGRVHFFDRLGYPGVSGRIRILEDVKTTLSE